MLLLVAAAELVDYSPMRNGLPASAVLLALFLFVAGVAHLHSPEPFLAALPPFFPAAEACITLTGFLEMLAAAALLYAPWRRLAAYWLAVYFVAITPVHFYVALHGIAMFGVSHPVALWGRTVLQVALVAWTLHIARSSPRWEKGTAGHVLVLASLYNVCFGLWAIFYPSQAFRAAALPPPNYPELWQCIGMIVGVYGVGYAIASRDPLRHWPIVLVGLLGKVFGPIGFLYALAKGSLPLSFGALIVTNDLLWWWPFAAILLAARRAFRSTARA